VATNRHTIRRRRRDELRHDQMLELWLGPHPDRGSLFNDREELQSAWDTHRDVLMKRWGSHGRRPQIWWELATEMQFPGLDREKSTLWRAGVLAPAERAELEAEWRTEFERAQNPKFSYQLKPGRSAARRGENCTTARTIFRMNSSASGQLSAGSEAEKKRSPRSR
jgi:hypothetical protein